MRTHVAQVLLLTLLAGPVAVSGVSEKAFAAEAPKADLSIEVNGPDGAAPGAAFEYTMTIQNAGPKAVMPQGVIQIPWVAAKSFSFREGEIDSRCALVHSRRMRCSGNILAAGESVTFTIPLLVATTAKCNYKPKNTYAFASSSKIDPDPTNNETEKTFFVDCSAPPTGNLYVTQDASPTRSRQLLAGDLGEAILRLELRAENEPIDVTRIVLTDVSGNLPSSISRLELFLAGATTPFALATIDQCQGAPVNGYCADMPNAELIIPAGNRVDVLVHARLKTDEQGAVSGEQIQLQVTGATAIQARGRDSSNNLLQNDGDATAEGEVFIGVDSPLPNASIIGNKNDTVLAKIIAIEDVNPDADGTNVPVGTNKKIAEFKFTAAANSNTLNGLNKATLSGLIFNISSTNVMFTAANFDLFNKNDASMEISCTSFDGNGNGHSVGTGSGSFYVACSKSNNTSVNLEMDSGSAITLVLQADISNNQISATKGSALQVAITNFSDRTLAGLYKPTASNSHIQWTDSLSAGSSAVIFGWIENDQTSVSSTSYDL